MVRKGVERAAGRHPPNCKRTIKKNSSEKMSTSRLLALRSRLFRCTRHGTTPHTSRACHAYKHKPRPASAPPPLFSRSGALSHVLLAMFNRLVATQNDGVRCRGACLCLLAFFCASFHRRAVHPHATAHSRAFCLQHAGRAVLRQADFLRSGFLLFCAACVCRAFGGRQAGT